MTLPEQSVCAFTATPDAITRFCQAVSYAEALVHNQAESNQAPAIRRKIEEHGEWLRWGLGRISHTTDSRS